MVTDPTRAIRILTTDECWQRLKDHLAKVGRLGTGGPSPDILPVNYAVDGRSVVFHTAAGKKLAAVNGRERVVSKSTTSTPVRRAAGVCFFGVRRACHRPR